MVLNIFKVNQIVIKGRLKTFQMTFSSSAYHLPFGTCISTARINLLRLSGCWWYLNCWKEF